VVTYIFTIICLHTQQQCCIYALKYPAIFNFTSPHILAREIKDSKNLHSCSELDDVRQRLAIEKNRGRYVPLRLFRSWGQTVISVTDIVAGLWCEVQVEYKHLHKHLKHTGGWSRMAEQGRPIQLKTAEMMRGATIHLKKGT